MFEHVTESPGGGSPSAIEAAFQRVLAGLVFEFDGSPHAPRRAIDPGDGDAVDDGGAADPGEPVDAAWERRDASPWSGELAAARADHLDQLVARGAEQLAIVQEAAREHGRTAARQARALAAFARHRPSSFDRPDSDIGAAAAATRAARPTALVPVSEWAVDEVMVALSLNSAAATALLVDSLQLVDRLPLTLAALGEGRISWAHARVMTDLVAPLDDEVRSVAESRLLARVQGKTHNQLRVAARRMVQRLDAGAVARRVTEAIRERRVVVYPGDDGMATLSVVLPLPVARAVQDALRQYADAAATAGDERTRAQRMVDCLVDLVLRPGEHGLTPVQARLTIVAAVETLLGSDEPGEVDGEMVPAHMVRELAAALGLLPPMGPVPAGAAPGGDGVPGPADGADTVDGPVAVDETDEAETVEETDQAETVDETDQAGTRGTAAEAADHRDVAGAGDPAGGRTDDLTGHRGRGSVERIRQLGELLRSRQLGSSALEHRPFVALSDELSGQLVALTDAVGLRRGTGLGPPPESPGYRPAAELDRFVRLRDRRCRFPGCRARPVRCDLDHTVPWPAGPTSAANLCSLCRHHHRLSHQAPGWRLRGLADGGLEWTTPGGLVATTYPPRFGADDDVRPSPVGAEDVGPWCAQSPAGVEDPDDPPPY